MGPAIKRKTRKDFQRLADLRAKEAAALAKSRNYPGAYYLAGFAIECALKACIARKTKRHEFPDKMYANMVYTHKLEELLKIAELNGRLDNDLRANPILALNWGVVKAWNVDTRYETTGLNGKEMVSAVNSQQGILEWIRQYW